MQVDSSAVRDIAYDAPRRRLSVTFQSGARYAYLGVAPEVWRAFLAASSKGRFFMAEIRDRYRCEKLRPSWSAGHDWR